MSDAVSVRVTNQIPDTVVAAAAVVLLSRSAVLLLLLRSPNILTLVCLFLIVIDVKSAAALASSATVSFQFRAFAHLQKVAIQLLHVLLSKALKDESLQASARAWPPTGGSDYPHDAVQVTLVGVANEDVCNGERLLPVKLVLLEVGRRRS